LHVVFGRVITNITVINGEYIYGSGQPCTYVLVQETDKYKSVEYNKKGNHVKLYLVKMYRVGNSGLTTYVHNHFCLFVACMRISQAVENMLYPFLLVWEPWTLIFP
jgi:hypothetical protein